MLDLPSTYPHVPIEDMLLRIRRDDAGKPRKRILILGAGIAGLVAAYELQSLGHSVRIVEGSGRLGGRIFTHHFADGSYNELGAMRVPSAHDYTRYYIRKMELDRQLIAFVNSTDQNFLDIHQTVVRAGAGMAAIYPKYGLPGVPPEPPAVYPQSSGGAIFGWLLDTAIATLTPFEKACLFEGKLTTDRLRYLDSLSLGAFLDTAVPHGVKQLVGAYTSLIVWLDKAVTMFIRDQIVGTGNGLQTLLGGMSQLPDAIAERLPVDSIEQNAEAMRIAITSDTSVAVDLKTPKGPRTEVADFVLCTLPFGVMRQMALEGLSYDKMTSISEMTYAASTKVILDCRHRFWESKYGIYGGASISDGIQRQTYYPMDHIGAAPAPADQTAVGLHASVTRPQAVTPRVDADPRIAGALLGAYCWGSDAARLGALTPDRRAEATRRGVARYHPEILDDDVVVDHASMCWGTYKWSVGAFAFLQPGQLGKIWSAAGRPEGRLFFAGEHCSLDQAWIQGALISSLQAVDQIVNV